MMGLTILMIIVLSIVVSIIVTAGTLCYVHWSHGIKMPRNWQSYANMETILFFVGVFVLVSMILYGVEAVAIGAFIMVSRERLFELAKDDCEKLRAVRTEGWEDRLFHWVKYVTAQGKVIYQEDGLIPVVFMKERKFDREFLGVWGRAVGLNVVGNSLVDLEGDESGDYFALDVLFGLGDWSEGEMKELVEVLNGEDG